MQDEIDKLILMALGLCEKRTVTGDTVEATELLKGLVSFGVKYSLGEEIQSLIRLHVPTTSRQRMSNSDAREIIKYLLSVRSRIAASRDVCKYLHPDIAKVSESRMKVGQYADSVESAFKKLCNAVKDKARPRLKKELDGQPLMQHVFSRDKPILIVEEDLERQTNRDTQQGYMMMFSGAMSAIRNPKAHENMTISKDDAMRKLMFASMLMYKLDASKLATK